MVSHRALCLVLILLSGTRADAGEPEPSFARGVIVSCPMAGKIWGSKLMAGTLDELSELGVQWVSIHPYAWVNKKGEVEPYSQGEDAYLRRAAALVHGRKMGLFWKPHLGYWGSFEWRGTIEFGDDERVWKRFFEGYRLFIVAQARLAEELGVEMFAMGVELDATLHRPEWISIISEVRKVYSGLLLYAANWDRVESVPFWDRLDLIGVHAYYPLSQEAEPTREALVEGWKGPLDALSSLSARHGGKRVLFAEIGYNRSSRAAGEPWDYAVENTPATRALRRRLIEVALEGLPEEPWIAGIFWWKWMPGEGNDRWDRNFSMRDDEAREALSSYWSKRGDS